MEMIKAEINEIENEHEVFKNLPFEKANWKCNYLIRVIKRNQTKDNLNPKNGDNKKYTIR